MTKEKKEKQAHASSTGHAMAAEQWLDNHFLAMQPEYEEMLRWVGLQPGWHVLDAGCGSGSFLPLMTELVGERGRVSAIDLAPENVSVVQNRAKHSQWAAPVSARAGSIMDLPYEDNTFDALWCANTIQYLADDDLRTALAEFLRVTRPGGLVAVKDFDVTATQIQPTTPTLFIHSIEALCRHGGQQQCGLLRTIELPNWLRQAGLVNLRQKPTLMVRFQPLDDAVKQLLTEYFQYSNQQLQQLELPPEEAQLWQKLADTNAPDHIFHHPDFQYRTIQTVFLGQVPQ